VTLVSADRYAAITGDNDTDEAAAEDALAEAQALLEEELGRRGLLEDDGTDKVERLLIRSDSSLGFVVYPTAIPITDAGTLTQAGAVLSGASPDSSPAFVVQSEQWATVTYRGGYTADTVPESMARDIAWAAYRLLRPAAMASVPAGAKSVRLGDAAVTFDRPHGGGTPGVSWSTATLRHRKRRV
jgi:hypothetical protein